jgi:hypothetical protein
MPYANETMSERRSHLRAVKKAQDPCACGRPKDCTSTQCRKCYDAERRPRSESSDGFTVCPSCNGRMSVHRAQCVACTRGQSTGSRRVGGGRGKTIRAYLACPPVGEVTADTLIYCWYWKPRRINILAPNLGTAKKYIQSFYADMPSEIMGSVCRISGININLTDIDLSQFNGATT